MTYVHVLSLCDGDFAVTSTLRRASHTWRDSTCQLAGSAAEIEQPEALVAALEREQPDEVRLVEDFVGAPVPRGNG